MLIQVDDCLKVVKWWRKKRFLPASSSERSLFHQSFNLAVKLKICVCFYPQITKNRSGVLCQGTQNDSRVRSNQALTSSKQFNRHHPREEQRWTQSHQANTDCVMRQVGPKTFQHWAPDLHPLPNEQSGSCGPLYKMQQFHLRAQWAVSR